MQILVFPTPEELDRQAAGMMAEAIRRRKDAVVGLSTGRTTGDIHRAFVRLVRETGLDCSEVTFFGQDEVAGVPREYAGACYTMLMNEIIGPLGIPEGRGGGIFDPNARSTRQEAAVMLCRAYAACGGEVTAGREVRGFADGETIAPWAAEAVRFLHGRGVLQGVGKNRFDPLGDLTVEQCAVCFLRLSEELPVSFLKGSAPHLFTQEEVISAIQPADGITRWDGPLAVFIRRDQGTVLGDTAYFLAYADGGIRSLEAGVPSHSYGFPFDTAGFSEDGTVFTYTVTVEEDEYDTLWREGEPAERVLLAEAGVYTVVIDVPTGTQTVARESLEPKEGRWDDVPEDAWYREAAAYCDDLGLLSETAKRRYEPEGTVTLGQMTEAFAHAYASLTTGIWGLPLRPDNWGEAVLRLATR